MGKFHPIIGQCKMAGGSRAFAAGPSAVEFNPFAGIALTVSGVQHPGLSLGTERVGTFSGRGRLWRIEKRYQYKTQGRDYPRPADICAMCPVHLQTALKEKRCQSEWLLPAGSIRFLPFGHGAMMARFVALASESML